MRHRLGGVHCQTYEELFDILDSKTSQNCLSLDIQALLQEQQHTQNTHIRAQTYFFDEKHQIQADEEELIRCIDANLSETTVRSSSIVLICQHLYLMRQQLTNQQFIKAVYGSIYGETLAEREEIEVQVMSNIVNVRSMGHKESADPVNTPYIQEQSVFAVQEGYLYPKVRVQSEGSMSGYLGQLQLVIYYNKIGQNNNKKPQYSPKVHNTAHQHKIWLVKQQSHYSPLFKIYLQKAHRILHATLSGSTISQPSFYEVQIAELESQTQYDSQSSNNNGRESKLWREVLSEIEFNGVDDKGNRKQ